MPVEPPIGIKVTAAAFSFYTRSEARRVSVRQITQPVSFNDLGNPVPGGVHDPALGPCNKTDVCVTCGLIYSLCPGHCGHIDLAEPLYSPLLLSNLVNFLKCACWYCGRLRARDVTLRALLLALDAASRDDAVQAAQYAGIVEALERNDIGSIDFAPEAMTDEEFLEKVRSGRAREEFAENLPVFAQPPEGQHAHAQNIRRELVRNIMRSMSSPSTHKQCIHCKKERARVRIDTTKTKILVDNYHRTKDDAEGLEGKPGHTFFTSSRVRSHLRKVFSATEVQKAVLHAMFASYEVKGLPEPGADMFFIETLIVPPNRFRPVVEMGGIRSEDPQTSLLKKIVQLNNDLIRVNKGIRTIGDKTEIKLRPRTDLLLDLQAAVNDLCINSDPLKAPSIKSILEKKEGLFRKNMMGKRVNFAARSVISPDPYIDSNEIGLPLYFARRLSYPEPVNPRNVELLRQYVLNGPDVYPGANFVEDEFGTLIKLNNPKTRQSEADRLLSVNPAAPRQFKTVHRHLRDGDMALVNRQPTLHKPGIMAHKVRVLGSERTIRMHYSNCSTYNADFDGDEMNIHLPQGELARAEAKYIAFTDHQYFVPKDGGPLRGLIQDSVITGVLLTKKDTLFTQGEFQQLLWACLFNVNTQHAIKTPPPAIMKPRPMWTGKQLVSAVLSHVTVTMPPINYEGKVKVAGNMWGRGGYKKPIAKSVDPMLKQYPQCDESVAYVRNNELLFGILDKSQFGASAYGLVHSCFELYGAHVAGNMLSVLGRLFVVFMQTYHGFTCGIDDLVLQPDADNDRRLMLHAANQQASTASKQHVSRGHLRNKTSGEVEEAILEGMCDARRDPHKRAELDSVVKGTVNKYTSKVIDRCLPDGTIKPFPKNCMGLMTGSGARGSNVNMSQISCLLGQQELEGKRVPVMVSGRTLPSFARYDTSARAGGFVMDRFLTGIRPQEFYFHCMAGREGLIDTAVKTATSGYLQRCVIKSLECLTVQYDYTVRDADGSVIQFRYGDDALDVLNTSYMSKFKFWATNYDSMVKQYNVKSTTEKFNPKDVKHCFRKMDKILADPEHNDPLICQLYPGQKLGIMSEKFYTEMKKYVNEDPDHIFAQGKLDPRKFEGLMALKYSRSLVNPGESVGLVAAESIGEPATQMTLNTFHLAGRGDVNVTLGMPRLKEILMYAKEHIATPTMTINTLSGTKEDAMKVAHKLSKLTLTDLICDVALKESLSTDPHSGMNLRHYTVEVTFMDNYKTTLKDFGIKLGGTFKSKMMEFEKLLQSAITRQTKMTSREISATIGAEKTRMRNAMAEQEDSSDSDGEDTDENAAKKAAKKKKKTVKSQVDDDEFNDDEMNPDEMDAEAQELVKRKVDQATYDAPDDEDKLEESSLDGSSSSESESSSDESSSESEEEEKKKKSKKSKKEKKEKKEKKPKRKTTKSAAAEGKGELRYEDLLDESMDGDETAKKPVLTYHYALPADRKVMMMNIVEDTLSRVVLAQCPGIARCHVTTNSATKKYVVQTEGVNFGAVSELEGLVDMKTLYSNDVAAILKFYGVEAARQSIVNEVNSVYKVYGINVDLRHLGLAADFMTFLGGYRSLNRTGMEHSPSPLLKMSFETTAGFLTKAALYRQVDLMGSPASRIVVGTPIANGTGAMELRQIIPEGVQLPDEMDVPPNGETVKGEILDDAQAAITNQSADIDME